MTRNFQEQWEKIERQEQKRERQPNFLERMLSPKELLLSMVPGVNGMRMGRMWSNHGTKGEAIALAIGAETAFVGGPALLYLACPSPLTLGLSISAYLVSNYCGSLLTTEASERNKSREQNPFANIPDNNPYRIIPQKLERTA